MCDGYIEEFTYTIRRRGDGEALGTDEGFVYVFSDEQEARAFVAKRLDSADLEIVATPSGNGF